MSDLITKVTAAWNGGFSDSRVAREKSRLAIKAMSEWLAHEVGSHETVGGANGVVVQILAQLEKDQP